MLPEVKPRTVVLMTAAVAAGAAMLTVPSHPVPARDFQLAARPAALPAASGALPDDDLASLLLLEHAAAGLAARTTGESAARHHLWHLGHERHLAHESHLRAVRLELRTRPYAGKHRQGTATAPAPAAVTAATTGQTPQSYARGLVGSGQYGCLYDLWMRESGWRWDAQNPGSGAYGIPQSLPGSKMASAGPDWQTNPYTQIKWGIGYIDSTYGDACGAWAHEESAGWY